MGFGLCINGMNWPFLLYFSVLAENGEGRLKFPRAIDEAGNCRRICGLLTLMITEGIRGIWRGHRLV